MASMNVEKVVCSSLSRAMETASIIFPECRRIVVMDEMREFAGPPLSEKRHSITELKTYLPEVPYKLVHAAVDLTAGSAGTGSVV